MSTSLHLCSMLLPHPGFVCFPIPDLCTASGIWKIGIQHLLAGSCFDTTTPGCLHLLDRTLFFLNPISASIFFIRKGQDFPRNLKMRKHFITALYAQNRKDSVEYLETLFLSISRRKTEYLPLWSTIFVVPRVFSYSGKSGSARNRVLRFILDTEHSENLKMKFCFTDCSAFRPDAVPVRYRTLPLALEYIGNHYIEALFCFSGGMRIFSCILPTWEAYLKSTTYLWYSGTFPISGSALLRNFEKKARWKFPVAEEYPDIIRMYYFSKKFKKPAGVLLQKNMR